MMKTRAGLLAYWPVPTHAAAMALGFAYDFAVRGKEMLCVTDPHFDIVLFLRVLTDCPGMVCGMLVASLLELVTSPNAATVLRGLTGFVAGLVAMYWAAIVFPTLWPLQFAAMLASMHVLSALAVIGRVLSFLRAKTGNIPHETQVIGL
ncbi:MAG: hypothetical protein ACU0FH_12365 [Heliomarina sp.]|uniref:hypothetical protein n=1 Tax=Heliomarina sp. TaxID=2917556 RepID=UPI004059B2E0